MGPWVAAADARRILEAATGEPWPLARLIDEASSTTAAPGAFAAVWIEWTPAAEPLLQGRREGAALPVVLPADLEPLRAGLPAARLTMTRRPGDGETIAIDPGVPFTADDLLLPREGIEQSARVLQGAERLAAIEARIAEVQKAGGKQADVLREFGITRQRLAQLRAACSAKGKKAPPTWADAIKPARKRK